MAKINFQFSQDWFLLLWYACASGDGKGGWVVILGSNALSPHICTCIYWNMCTCPKMANSQWHVTRCNDDVKDVCAFFYKCMYGPTPHTHNNRQLNVTAPQNGLISWMNQKSRSFEITFIITMSLNNFNACSHTHPWVLIIYVIALCRWMIST